MNRNLIVLISTMLLSFLFAVLTVLNANDAPVFHIIFITASWLFLVSSLALIFYDHLFSEKK